MQKEHPPRPPRWADRLLQWYCKPELLEDLQGDLYEYFQRNVQSKGLSMARFIYVIDVIKFIRPYTTRSPVKSRSMNHPSLIRHYLKTGFRGLGKSKLFTGINVLGMAISMSVGLLMIAYLSELKSFDRFHSNYSRMYRVISSHTTARHGIQDYASTSPLAGQRIANGIPGVEQQVTIQRSFDQDVAFEDKRLPLRGLWASADFFHLFPFELLTGNAATALQAPYSLVLSQSAAEKLFRSTEVIGRAVTIEDQPYTVTAVAKDPPRNSHLDFEMLGSLSTLEQKMSVEQLASWQHWTNIWNNYVYVTLNENADLKAVQQSLDRISERENEQDETNKIQLALQPLSDVVISQNLSNHVGYHVEKAFLWFLGILALVVMISACFNHTNLSIARALRRSKEVGVRKVMGASRSQVFTQFLVEAVIMSMIALGFSFLLFLVIRPHFLGIEPAFFARISLHPSLSTYLYFVVLAVSVGLLAGFLPAFFFSKINPAKVMKDISKLKLFKHLSLRKALITFQYVLSICFMVAITLVYHQYRYFLSYDLGFNTENILNIELQGNDYQLLKDEIEQLSDVTGISASKIVPSVGDTYSTSAKLPGAQDSTFVHYNVIDEHYLQLHQHQLIAGENFSPLSAESQEESTVIANEKALTFFELGTPLEAVGRELIIGGKRMQIIGVVKDFHNSTLRDPIRRFVFRRNPEQLQVLNLKLATADLGVTMDRLEAIWDKIDPVHPFRATFFEESIQNAYNEYTAMIKIIGFLAILAITIASFGLLGMVIFTTETRFKEISIRKIMGATERGLVMMLSRGFLTLLLIACLIGVPATYFMFDQLVFSDLAARAPIGPFELLPGVLSVVAIALLAISSQTIRVAKANPVEALRNE